MRDELLALLEDGPKAQRQLAAWLDVGLYAVGRVLQVLADEQLVKRTQLQRLPMWALTTYQPPIGGRPRKSGAPPPKPRVQTPELTRIENVVIAPAPPKPPDSERVETRRGRPKRLRAGTGADVDRALGIVEPVGGLSVCAAAGCGKRFTPDRESDRFCSEACLAAGPPTDTRTIVVDGVEFEAVSAGRLELCQRPDDGLIRGSSLSGLHEVKHP